STVRILAGAAERDPSRSLPAIITSQAVVDMADLAATVHVDDAVLEYVSQLAERTRTAPEARLGVSVRGALALGRTTKVWAAAQGRHYVVPDDGKGLVQPAWNPRSALHAAAERERTTPLDPLERALAEAPAPQARRNVA